MTGPSAWDWDGTLVTEPCGYEALSDEDYLAAERIANLQPLWGEVERARQAHLESGIVIVTGRHPSLTPAITAKLQELGLGGVRIVACPKYEGDDKLAHWKAGVLQALGVRDYQGDRESDAVAAKLAGVPFRYCGIAVPQNQQVNEWVRAN